MRFVSLELSRNK